MTLKLSKIVETLNQLAPTSLAESYDNVGLLVGEPDTDIHGALTALELTDAVLDEAEAAGANLIVTHHPIWFGAKKRLLGDEISSRLILRAIRSRIALYASHTNLDAVRHGVNHKIAEKVGLTDLRILQPRRPEDANTGAGMIGRLLSPMEPEDFLAYLQEVFQTPCLRYAPAQVSTIETVAFCGGAGSFLIDAALKAGAHAYFTGDLTHHKFFENENQMLLVDVGHWESEQFTPEILFDFIRKNFPTFAVALSRTNTNPVKFKIKN